MISGSSQISSTGHGTVLNPFLFGRYNLSFQSVSKGELATPESELSLELMLSLVSGEGINHC